MGQRLDLQTMLETLLGSSNVYFQPPATLTMAYPCIVYTRDAEDKTFAGNLPYKNVLRYQVTLIDRNPDSLILKKLSALPLSTYDRFYIADNLNHDVYRLYF